MVNAKGNISSFLQPYSVKIGKANVLFVFLTLERATPH